MAKHNQVSFFIPCVFDTVFYSKNVKDNLFNNMSSVGSYVEEYTKTVFAEMCNEYRKLDHLDFIDNLMSLAFSGEFHAVLTTSIIFAAFREESCFADYFDHILRSSREPHLWEIVLAYDFELDDTILDVMERFISVIGPFHVADGISESDAYMSYIHRADVLLNGFIQYVDDLMYCIEREFDTTEHILWLSPVLNLQILKESIQELRYNNHFGKGGLVFTDKITRKDLQQIVTSSASSASSAAFARKKDKLALYAGLGDYIEAHRHDE